MRADDALGPRLASGRIIATLSELWARDAAGHALTATMRPHADGDHIEVDDRDATYPLVVDRRARLPGRRRSVRRGLRPRTPVDLAADVRRDARPPHVAVPRSALRRIGRAHAVRRIRRHAPRRGRVAPQRGR
jgi:hypothetical protein